MNRIQNILSKRFSKFLKFPKFLKFSKLFIAILFCFLSASTITYATTYPLSSNNPLIGQIQYYRAEPGDNVVTVAKLYDIGYNAIKKANPHLNMAAGFPNGVVLQMPTMHLLPNFPYEGIVINLPEMRMYYFVNSQYVQTYPIGIGKIGKTIPITKTAITHKMINPTWTPPDDIRDYNLEQGIVLPSQIPPGPDNPLGPYAIYMKIPTYLIHSTIFPDSIGRRASFGCIRMYESDIKEFFPSIASGIPVTIINEPVKIHWQGNHLYLEVHEPLEEHNRDSAASLSGIVKNINHLVGKSEVLVDWQLVAYISKERDGIPHEIGVRIAS